MNFSGRLRAFLKKHNMRGAELARRLGVSRPYISMLLHDKNDPSRQFIAAFELLEKQLDDPFLAACAAILHSDDDRVVEGFTMNIYSVLRNLDEKEAQRLKDFEPIYHERRRGKRKRAGGE